MAAQICSPNYQNETKKNDSFNSKTCKYATLTLHCMAPCVWFKSCPSLSLWIWRVRFRINYFFMISSCLSTREFESGERSLWNLDSNNFLYHFWIFSSSPLRFGRTICRFQLWILSSYDFMSSLIDITIFIFTVMLCHHRLMWLITYHSNFPLKKNHTSNNYGFYCFMVRNYRLITERSYDLYYISEGGKRSVSY